MTNTKTNTAANMDTSGMDQVRVLDLFRETQAMLEGHFVLSSGLHSDRYFQCALVLERPDKAAILAEEMARQLRAAGLPRFDIVIGPALGAVTWAYEVARALGARAQFTERKDDTMQLRRGFQVKPGDSVFVVEDVFTTGGSAREVIDVLQTYGVEPRAVGCIVNRSGKNPFEQDGLRLFALAQVKAEAWAPDDCPLCKARVPLVKPGSRAKPG
jgi:orotate phosphoribosyltransferase